MSFYCSNLFDFEIFKRKKRKKIECGVRVEKETLYFELIRRVFFLKKKRRL
jgi:hypothetical protein